MKLKKARDADVNVEDRRGPRTPWQRLKDTILPLATELTADARWKFPWENDEEESREKAAKWNAPNKTKPTPATIAERKYMDSVVAGIEAKKRKKDADDFVFNHRRSPKNDRELNEWIKNGRPYPF